MIKICSTSLTGIVTGFETHPFTKRDLMEVLKITEIVWVGALRHSIQLKVVTVFHRDSLDRVMFDRELNGALQRVTYPARHLCSATPIQRDTYPALHWSRASPA